MLPKQRTNFFGQRPRVLFKESLRVYDSTSASWNDGTLSAKSDGTVKYRNNGAIGAKLPIEIGPFVTTTRPKFGNFDFVFVINTVPEDSYYTGPRFACKTLASCERWISVLNLIALQKKLQIKHNHPLTKTNGRVAKAPCNICKKNQPVETKIYYMCEFCNYGECDSCYDQMNDKLEEFVESKQHPHPLMRLNSARGMWISAEYKGTYQCDICDTVSKTTVYHCVECGDYDLCPVCTFKMPEGHLLLAPPEIPTFPENDGLRLNPQFLSPVLGQRLGTGYKLYEDSAKCPQKMSLITSKCFNLDQIDTQVCPTAYMEVKFKAFNKGSTVGVGIGNQIFRQNEFLGHQQNSYGVFNDGTACVNSPHTQFACPQFEAGDTIGIGIMKDSFNQRVVFFTKNGKRVGTFEQTVHLGMDCFPGVFFSKDSKVEFKENFDGPFKCDLTTVAGARCDKDLLSNLPTEITEIICSLAVNSAARALQLRDTSKVFAKALLSNKVWRRVFLLKWPNQNPNLKVKSWQKLYAKRNVAVQAAFDPQTIENCDFEFECPVLWSKLEAKGVTKEGERFCDKCHKTVYSVSDVATLNLYAEMGRCVSLEVERESKEIDDGGRRHVKRGKMAAPKAFTRVNPFS